MHTSVRRAVIIVALLFWTAPALGLNNDAIRRMEAEVAALPWEMGPAVQTVPGANATYRQSRDERWVDGENAVRAMTLLSGLDKWESANALALDIYDQTVIVIEHLDVGYIDDEDWREFDAEMVLDLTTSSLEEANEERQRRGYTTSQAAGFALRPAYDEEEHAVYWAMRYLNSEGNYFIAAYVLKLSRDGFTQIVWGGPVNRFQGRQTLDAALAPFRYNEGAAYQDFQEGDAVAALGLAALSTRLMTGRSVRGGGRAGAVLGLFGVLFKYFSVFLLAPIYFLWRLLFRRR